MTTNNLHEHTKTLRELLKSKTELEAAINQELAEAFQLFPMQGPTRTAALRYQREAWERWIKENGFEEYLTIIGVIGESE